MKRTFDMVEINNALEIVRLDGSFKFMHPLGYTLPTGYCLKHPVKGFLAFKGNTEPYVPLGGKDALLSILQADGFLNLDDIVWLQPMI